LILFIESNFSDLISYKYKRPDISALYGGDSLVVEFGTVAPEVGVRFQPAFCFAKTWEKIAGSSFYSEPTLWNIPWLTKFPLAALLFSTERSDACNLKIFSGLQSVGFMPATGLIRQECLMRQL